MNVTITQIHPDIKNIISELKHNTPDPSDPDFRADFSWQIGELHNEWIGAKILFPHDPYLIYSSGVDLDYSLSTEYKDLNIWSFAIRFSNSVWQEPDTFIEIVIIIPKGYIYQFAKNEKYAVTLFFCPEKWEQGVKFKNLNL